jgi:hypothetical protein
VTIDYKKGFMKNRLFAMIFAISCMNSTQLPAAAEKSQAEVSLKSAIEQMVAWAHAQVPAEYMPQFRAWIEGYALYLKKLDTAECFAETAIYPSAVQVAQGFKQASLQKIPQDEKIYDIFYVQFRNKLLGLIQSQGKQDNEKGQRIIQGMLKNLHNNNAAQSGSAAAPIKNDSKSPPGGLPFE